MTKFQTPAVTEDELHAYVDGLLPIDRLADVESHLAANPDVKSEVEKWRSQRLAISGLFGNVQVKLSPGRAKRGRGLFADWRYGAVAATLAVIAFGFGTLAGAFISSRLDMISQVEIAPSTVATWASANHTIYAADMRHPVEVGGDQKDHLVQWLSKRFGAPIKAPELKAAGYELMGGRLISFGEQPAALLMYQNQSGDRISLAIGRSSNSSDTAFSVDSRNGVNTLYWIDGSVGYGVSGNLPTSEIREVASVIYEQL